jgi:hypothetical protein
MIRIDRPSPIQLFNQQNPSKGVRQSQIGQANPLMGGFFEFGV